MRASLLGVFFWLAGCLESQTLQCENGLTCPLDQHCDLAHGACVDADQLSACDGMPDMTVCSAVAVPDGTCDQGVCLAANCGDGVVQGLEECDGSADTMTCSALGYYDAEGDPPCRADCTYEVNPIRAGEGCTGYCGDGEVRIGKELCDRNEPPLTCTDLGYGAGHLACNRQTCGPALDDCKLFGWAHIAMPSRMADIHGTGPNNAFAVSAEKPQIQFYNGLEWSAVDLAACGLTSTARFTNAWTVGPHAAFATFSDNKVVQITATTCIAHPFTMTPNDVWGASATDVYVAASDGIHHFDGSTWTVVSATPRTRIWGAAANDIWAGGANNTLMHFDGVSWSSSTTLPGLTSITALWGTGPANIYAAGSQSSTDYVYRYNGTTWTPIYTVAGSGIRSGTFAHGHPIIGFGSGRIMSYDGTRWATLLQAGVFSIVFGLWTEPVSQKVFAGVNGAPFLLGFEGTVRLDIPPNGPANRIEIKSENEVYAVDSDNPINGRLYMWNGLMWTHETAAGGNVDDVWVDPTGVVRIIDGGGSQIMPAGGIRRRTNATTWPTVLNLEGYRIWGASGTDFWVIAGDDQNGYFPRHIVNDVVVPCAECLGVSAMRDIHGTSTSNVFFVGNFGTILRYNGTNVTVMQSGTTEHLLTVQASPDNAHVWAGGDNGTLLHLNGSTWEPVPTPNAASPISAVWGTSPSDLFIGQLGFMYHFDGTHWAPVASGALGTIGDFDNLGDTLVYVDGKPLPSTVTMRQLVRIAPW